MWILYAIMRSYLHHYLGRNFRSKLISNTQGVCNVSKTLGLSYSSQEVVSVVLSGGKIVYREQVLGILDLKVQKNVYGLAEEC